MSEEFKGSNDLNMFLKAKVVELKVKLDIKGSHLPKQVDDITDYLEDSPVYLNIKLLPNWKEIERTIGLMNDSLQKNESRFIKLNTVLSFDDASLLKDIKEIQSKVNKFSGIDVKIDIDTEQAKDEVLKLDKTLNGVKNESLKIKVDIDVDNTIKKATKDIQKLYDTVEKFNNQYAKQLKKLGEVQEKLDIQKQKDDKAKGKPMGNVSTHAPVQNFNNIKRYEKQLAEAERMLRSKFADGLGNFSSTQIKDMQGNLLGFTASLERANGVVEKLKYSWNAEKEAFQIAVRQTNTDTQKMNEKATDMLKNLEREISKTGGAVKSLSREYDDLIKKASKGELTVKEVNLLKTKVNNHKEEVRVVKELKVIEAEREKLRNKINRLAIQDERRTNSQNKEKIKALSLEVGKNITSIEDLKKVQNAYEKLNGEITDNIRLIKEQRSFEKDRERLIRQLKTMERETNFKSGSASKDNIKRLQEKLKEVKTTEDLIAIEKEYSDMQIQRKNASLSQRKINLEQKLRTTLLELGKASNITSENIEKKFNKAIERSGDNLGELQRQINRFQKELKNIKFDANIDDLARKEKSQIKEILTPDIDTKKTYTNKGLSDLISNGDLENAKKYVEEWQKLRVAQSSIVSENGMTRIQTTLESTGKTARRLTYEIDNVSKKLHLIREENVFNRMANLGVFEQLRIAMARVPVWMVAMTAFYGTINSVRAMVTDILELDKILTEIRRVASDNISIDTIFQNSVQLSKELGNNVYDVLNAVSELSRTYGDFNERQLIAVTRTAVLMSNVSDLNAKEAVQSLIGTMNAFNIEAEESIRIVDSFNEVDKMCRGL